MLHVPAHLGYPVLFALVFGESAGVPLPGETALLTAGVLAGAGRLSLPFVIGIAVAAAVLGDTLGYWLGRRGGRAVLAGAGAMPWPRFALYNLAGAFVWAATVASLASLVGPAVAAGLWVAALAAAVGAALVAVVRARRGPGGSRHQLPGLG